MKKLTATILIPAFNEEINISTMINQLLRQKQHNFILKEIIVVSDGSDDATALIAKSFKHNKIRVFEFKEQLGKIKRLNQFRSKAKTDIWIEIDADMRIGNNKVLEKLVEPFYRTNNLGISCGYHQALLPKEKFETLPYFGYCLWKTAKEKHGMKAIRHYCEGGMRAFSKNFITKIRLPENVPLSEDSYGFYYAMREGFEVVLAKEAKVYFQLPTNYHDYIKQMKRFLTAPKIMRNRFGHNLVAKYDVINRNDKLTALVSLGLKKPGTACLYLILQITTRFQMLFYQPKPVWTVITNSKKLLASK